MPNIDPITLEVMRNALVAATEEMGAALMRSAYSTNIKTRADFSCAFLDAELRVVAQAFTQPAHLGSLVNIVPTAVREYGIERLREGDGIAVNHCGIAAGHLNDICLISPIFHRGALFGYVANLGHHVDVGGGEPGSVGASREIFQEGIIIPPVRLVDRWEVDANLFRLICANIRSPKVTGGDFRAQIASNKLGMRRFAELVERYGAEAYTEYVEALLANTSERTRKEFAALPRGVWRAEGFLDNDGISPEPVRIACTLRCEGDDVVVDFTGTDPERPAPANATYPMTFSAVAYVLKCFVDPDLPVNDGFYRHIRIVAPPGCLINARRPVAVVGGWETSMRTAGVLMRCFAQVMPERVIAGTKESVCNLGFGSIDPATGEYHTYYETVCGGYGAAAFKDGMEAVQVLFQNTENSPIEEMEAGHPVRIVRYQLRTDSDGPGKFRGGLGVRRDYTFRFPTRFSVMSDRATTPSWGLAGGGEGVPARYVVNPDREARAVNSKGTVALEPGGIFSVQTAGGGGYGPPVEREPEAVLADVRSGKNSLARARDGYGVIIDPATWTIDEAATAAARLRFRSDPRPPTPGPR